MPGGGGACGYVAAVGMSLGNMVLALTTGKKKYAEYQEMSIVGEYSDEGKSDKSVEGRPQFKQMLSDIESGKDNVDYVLVFKLSRFGRNAADVLGVFSQEYTTIDNRDVIMNR